MHSSDPNTNSMLGFGRTVLPMNYVRVWAHGFAQQEGKTEGRAYLVVLVAGEGAEVGR